MAEIEFQMIRPAAFGLLEETWKRIHNGDPQISPADSIQTLEETLVVNLGLSSGEAFRLVKQFVVAKITSERAGRVIQLPDELPKDPWVRKRVASWVWFYVDCRADNSNRLRRGKLREDLLKRSHFEFGNSDGESKQLLAWAETNLGKISLLFKLAIESGELSHYHQKLLDRFNDQLERGTLEPID